MKKFCFAAICMLIVAGCGDPSPTPDPEASGSTDAAPVSSGEGSAESGDSAATEEEVSEPEAVATTDSEAKPAREMPKSASKPDDNETDGGEKTEVAVDNSDKSETEAPAKAEDSSIAASITQIEEERSEAMQKFRKWYASASDEEKEADFSEHYPDPETYAGRVMKLATDGPEDPEAVKALLWVAGNSRGEKATAALEILLDKHGKNDEIADALPMLAYGYSEANGRILRKAATAGQTERIKAIGTLSLAQYLQRVPQIQQMVEGNPGLADQLGDDLDYIKNFKADATEVEKLYTTAVEKYGSISTGRGTIAESAESALYELQNLQIGMVAPNIEGADLDGVDFKLSDYKGKVVLLDFWGNW